MLRNYATKMPLGLFPSLYGAIVLCVNLERKILNAPYREKSNNFYAHTIVINTQNNTGI